MSAPYTALDAERKSQIDAFCAAAHERVMFLAQELEAEYPLVDAETVAEGIFAQALLRYRPKCYHQMFDVLRAEEARRALYEAGADDEAAAEDEDEATMVAAARAKVERDAA